MLHERSHRVAAAIVCGGLVLLLVFGLVAWQSSKPPPRRVYEGKVIDKRFDPAHTRSWLMPVTHEMCSGNPVKCTSFTTFIPMTDHIPDRWFITVRGCPRRAKEAPVEFCQKMRTRSLGVDEITYHDLAIGASWRARQ